MLVDCKIIHSSLNDSISFPSNHNSKESIQEFLHPPYTSHKTPFINVEDIFLIVIIVTKAWVIPGFQI